MTERNETRQKLKKGIKEGDEGYRQPKESKKQKKQMKIIRKKMEMRRACEGNPNMT